MISSTRLTGWPTPFLALMGCPPLRKKIQELMGRNVMFQRRYNIRSVLLDGFAKCRALSGWI